MSESQLEKMRKALAKAKRERDLSQCTVKVQDEIINELREDNERMREDNELLRDLLRECQPFVSNGHLFKEIQKEVGDER